MSSTREDVLTATVQHELGNQLFRLLLPDGSTLVAGLSTEAKRLGLPITTGMRVEVRRARLDPARGTVLGPVAAHDPDQRTTILDPTPSPRHKP